MKTKTKVAMGLILSAAIVTGVYAKGDFRQGNCQMQDGKQQMMQKNHQRGEHGIMKMLKKLNLTQDQQAKIADIKKDMMKNRVTPEVAFTKDGFDKAKFIEIMKQKRENMLESKAEMIDKVYKILTPNQKEQLKVLMELKKERMSAMLDKRM